MASWKKFKNRINKKEVKIRPVYDQLNLGGRKQIGIGIEIGGIEVIINSLQTKDLMIYILSIM